MADASECSPESIPAHLARLSDWRETTEHALRHELLAPGESVRSGSQLTHCCTLADWLAAAEITRRQHRAPAFLNSRDTELAKLNEKIDLLAGMLAAVLGDGYQMPGAFCKDESEVQA